MRMDPLRGPGSPGGFTLVELLVTSTLLTLVMGTVAATFAGGIQVWERVQAQSRAEEWVELTFEEFRRDLVNARRFSPIGFEGEYDEFAFPALVAWQPRGEAAREEVGRRGYYFDSARRVLCRSEHAYRQLRTKRLRDGCQQLMTGLRSVRWSYYAFDEDRGSYAWASSCSGAQPPLAVKMELRYDDPTAREPVTRVVVVRVPIAAAR